MSNIVKWAAVSDEETFAKVRVEFSFGDGSAVQKTVTMADFIRARLKQSRRDALKLDRYQMDFMTGY